MRAHCWFMIVFVISTCCALNDDLTCTEKPLSDMYECTVDVDYRQVYKCEFSSRTSSGGSCLLYSGMSLRIVCSNQTLFLYKNNVSVNANPRNDVSYPFVTASHSGIYECRRYDADTNGTVVVQSRSIVVNSAPAFGLPCNYQLLLTLPNNSLACGIPTVAHNDFNLYCENCTVSFETQWYNHVGTNLDVQMTRENNQSTAYNIILGPEAQIPYQVTPCADGYTICYPIAAIVVSATAPDGQKTILFFKITFNYHDTSDELYATLRPPPPQPQLSLGDEAVFECEYSSAKDSATIRLELQLNNGTTLTGACNSFSCDGQLELIHTFNYNLSVKVNVGKLTISNLTKAINNSLVTCSLLYDGAVQWKKAAPLVIALNNYTTSKSATPKLNIEVGKSAKAEQCPLYCQVVVPVLFAAILAGTIVAFAVLMVRRHKRTILNKDVTSQDPYKESVDGTCKYDIKALPEKVNVGVSSPSVGLDMTASHLKVNRRVKSLSHIDSRKNEVMRIYISYSEEKLSWIIGYLKPLIQRLIFGSEVTVHSNDMLAGHPISEERMRLILEANKVLIICSPGYEESPWCQYELLQSVSQDPSLTEGRIVSILCDGCKAVPSIISGVVSITDDDSKFESKLQQCLGKVIVKQ